MFLTTAPAVGQAHVIVIVVQPDPNYKGFKDKYLTWLKRSARNLIYIGDGLSDLEAARCADHVFATGHLATLLEAESVAWSCFIDFYDLLSQLQLSH